MDSDSESQDSDDGRRFRFEATRKDNVRPEPKLGKRTRSKSEHKSDYDDAEYKDRKDKSKHDSRREHRSSKERDTEDRDLRHVSKHSKHIHELKGSRRESSKEGKDYKSTRDVSVDSRTFGLSSKQKTRDTKQHRSRDQSEHRKHRSQDRSHSRNEDDRSSQNDKYRNKSHEQKYKHRSRDRSYQSHRQRSSDRGKSRGEFEKQNSHKRTLTKEDVDQQLQEFSSPKNAEHNRSDNELPATRDLSNESQGYKELDLSEFDVLSETDENMSDDSDAKDRCSFSRYHKTKTKKRISNDEHENTKKKQATENEHSDSSPKVNARKGDPSHGSSNNNPGAISDSAFGDASSMLTKSIMDNCTNDLDKSPKLDAREKTSTTTDLNSKLEKSSSGETTSLHLSNCDSPEPAKLSSSEEGSTYGPVLPPQLMTDHASTVKSAKHASFIGPCLPENYVQEDAERLEADAEDQTNENDSDEDSTIIFGPALPPHLLEQKHSNGTETKLIGPTPPSAIKPSNNEQTEQSDSENEDAIGPLPADHPALRSSYVYRQLEHRAQQIKSKQMNEVSFIRICTVIQ